LGIKHRLLLDVANVSSTDKTIKRRIRTRINTLPDGFGTTWTCFHRHQTCHRLQLQTLKHMVENNFPCEAEHHKAVEDLLLISSV